MTTNPILVTGAAGAVGAIGRSLTEFLLARGHKVRALVRREDERAEALRRLGAEVVKGDLTDLASMHRAIEGCGRIYFGMSVSPAYLEATINTAAVARHYGVGSVLVETAGRHGAADSLPRGLLSSTRRPGASLRRVGAALGLSSDAGLALRVDQDGSARRARGLHVMLVPAEVVRDVPVVHRWSRGHGHAPLHILRINRAGRVTTHVRSHHRAADCADARRKISPAATSDLMAKDTADDASHHCARDIDTR